MLWEPSRKSSREQRECVGGARGSGLLVLGVIAVFLVGCGGTANPTKNLGETSGPVEAAAVLNHVPTGTAILNWSPAQKTLIIQLTMWGMVPNSIHPAHIHNGDCARMGSVVYPLQDVIADGQGKAEITTTIQHVASGIPVEGWALNVHNGPGLSPETNFLPIACGNIRNLNPQKNMYQSVEVILATAPLPNQSVTGHANLSLSGSTLTVTINVDGLAPNSLHAAQILSGACNAQGNVVYALPALEADAAGHGGATSTVKNVSSIPKSGWYIIIHLTNETGTQTTEDGIACGDVVLTGS